MFDRGLNEECGVFGIWGVPDAANLAYYALHALQHRGQEGCGIVAAAPDGSMKRIKGEGLVTEVFDGQKLSSLPGSMAIGHVRYSTTGGGGIENVQPFLFRHHTGDFALAHNGNLVNYALLRKALEDKGSLFQSSSDSEVLAHLIKKDSAEAHKPRIFSIESALNEVDGAFAFLIMTANRIYACRDRYGLRPLALGRLGDGYVVSSETCAFHVIGAEYIRDIEPGEIVTIDHHGIRSRKYTDDCSHHMCAMEYIYFARPDSDIEGCNVHSFRKESGRLLYKGGTGGRRHRGRSPGLEPQCRDGIQRGIGPSLRNGAGKEPLYRKDVHPAFPGDEGERCQDETFRSGFDSEGEEGGPDRRLGRTGDYIEKDSADFKGSRCEGGASEDCQPADQEPLLLWSGYVHI